MDMQVYDQFYDVVMVGGGAANGAGPATAVPTPTSGKQLSA